MILIRNAARPTLVLLSPSEGAEKNVEAGPLVLEVEARTPPRTSGPASTGVPQPPTCSLNKPRTCPTIGGHYSSGLRLPGGGEDPTVERDRNAQRLVMLKILINIIEY